MFTAPFKDFKNVPTLHAMACTEEEEPEPEENPEPDEESEQVGRWFTNPQNNHLKVQRSGIGKYIAPPSANAKPAK